MRPDTPRASSARNGRPSADPFRSQGTNFGRARLQSKNPVEFPPGRYELDYGSKREGYTMDQAAHHYLIFETGGGFCGIAWNDAGITRFQLPAKSAEATERSLLRR